jgi:hypothetical protein
MAAEKWSIDGEIIDTCNCEVICPCTMGSPASFGSCLGNVTWCIDEGFHGDTDLSGCIAHLAINAPGPYFDDGNWRVAMYGDASATETQRESLKKIFLGEAGGFFGDWRAMMNEIVGVRWIPLEVERKGRKRIIRKNASSVSRAYWMWMRRPLPARTKTRLLSLSIPHSGRAPPFQRLSGEANDSLTRIST